jgi:hypothetical protein
MNSAAIIDSYGAGLYSGSLNSDGSRGRWHHGIRFGGMTNKKDYSHMDHSLSGDKMETYIIQHLSFSASLFVIEWPHRTLSEYSTGIEIRL